MTREHIKPIIKNFLLQQHSEGKEWVAEGIIDDYVRARTGSKTASTGRICRFMVEDGTLERTYKKFYEGKRPNVVYRVKVVVSPVLE